MKNLILFLIFLMFLNNCSAQRFVDRDKFAIGSSFASKGLLFIKIDSNAKWVFYQNLTENQPLTSYLFTNGAKKIALDLYIPGDSINYYRYSVIENGNKWLALNVTPHGQLQPSVDELRLPIRITGAPGYGNYKRIKLGQYDVGEGKIIIEYYKTTEPNKISNIIVYNKPITPVTILAVQAELINNNQQISHRAFLPRSNKPSIANPDDSTQVSKIGVLIKQPEPTFIYHVYVTNEQTHKTISVPNNWLPSSLDDQMSLWINADYFQEPGDYQFKIVPELSSERNSNLFNSLSKTFKIRILKAPRKYLLSEIVRTISLALLLVVCLMILIFIVLKKRSKTKEIIEKRENEFVLMKLNLIRSQLNPHFMFNALNGIQSLINNNKLEDANNYLVRFARLTRNILNHTDMVIIKDEISLLTDYLLMEQLRFNFQFEIKTDNQRELQEIKIPAMLIQPFVENSVKHAVSELGLNGYICIEINKISNNVFILIRDNGNGFDPLKKGKGHGTYLMSDRIILLNSIYKNTKIETEVKSSLEGTVVSLTLREWIK